MARLARVVAAGVPHYVTQRGNRLQPVFFCDEDYAAYRALLAEGCRAAGVEVWGDCLTPNQVHLILTPGDENGLRAALAAPWRSWPEWKVIFSRNIYMGPYGQANSNAL